MPGSQQSLAGLVLAAGGSSRLGCSKQLLRWRGKELVCHAVERSMAVCEAGVVVVAGSQAAEVQNCLRTYDVEIVVNSNWEAGMGSSLSIGVKVVQSRKPAGVLVMLCDQPTLRTEDLVHLATIWRTSPDRPAAARYNSILGAPAIFPSGYYSRLAVLQGDSGARALLNRTENCSILDIPAAAFDLDTEADLDRLRHYDD